MGKCVVVGGGGGVWVVSAVCVRRSVGRASITQIPAGTGLSVMGATCVVGRTPRVPAGGGLSVDWGLAGRQADLCQHGEMAPWVVRHKSLMRTELSHGIPGGPWLWAVRCMWTGTKHRQGSRVQ